MDFITRLVEMYHKFEGDGCVSCPSKEVPGRMYMSLGFSVKNQDLLKFITTFCNNRFVNYKCEFTAFGHVNITITL